ncbi:hypothetical protein BCU94_18660 [Shewanella sp. 10N.286.52.C2]|uniref:hypothetical protein n=1 Tax=Shewanella sp. 10N.286.52.C2 TaxID=1880838 RepID=UPI000C8271DE|nr:hypothetical protein [Shewanella sp. 10N.286.52.C2]PMG27914.1 hypothetical protein BCU94_18660 [Shewanella sp. 10N.286.52.C2]
MENPYEGCERQDTYSFIQSSIIPIMFMQGSLFFTFSGHYAVGAVSGIIFLLVLFSQEEIKLFKYDADFKLTFLCVYASTGLYSAILGFFDKFSPMLILIVIDTCWIMYIYYVYGRVYLEGSK